jgi:hypothetical protein
MSKPYIHAKSSAKKWGGVPEDYLEIHDLMDSSKAVFPDNRHRALTHNNWFIFIVEKIYGHNITNSSDRLVSVRDIVEQHILEDFGGKFIPTPQDYLENMEFVPWMNNAIEGAPPSHRKLQAKSQTIRRVAFTLD